MRPGGGIQMLMKFQRPSLRLALLFALLFVVSGCVGTTLPKRLQRIQMRPQIRDAAREPERDHVGKARQFSVGGHGPRATRLPMAEEQCEYLPVPVSASYMTPATVSGDNNATFRVDGLELGRQRLPATRRRSWCWRRRSLRASRRSRRTRRSPPGRPGAVSVVAGGTAPFTYQWQKNNVNISGATAANYTTPATTTADSDSKFRVVVTNSREQRHQQFRDPDGERHRGPSVQASPRLTMTICAPARILRKPR